MTSTCFDVRFDGEEAYEDVRCPRCQKEVVLLSQWEASDGGYGSRADSGPRLLYLQREWKSEFESYSVMLGSECLGSILTTGDGTEDNVLWNWSPPSDVVFFNSGLPTPLPFNEAMSQLLGFSASKIAEALGTLFQRKPDEHSG